MYQRLILLIIFIFILMPAKISAESGIPGWGKTKWGMTQAEVKKQFDLNPWEPDTIPTCKSKKKVRIWGQDFTVAFYFDERSASGRLFKVTLVHFNPPEADKGDTSWMNSIKDMLVEKYDTPELFEVKGNMKISQWKKTDGQLKLTTLTGRTVMCAMEYMAVSSEGQKL